MILPARLARCASIALFCVSGLALADGFKNLRVLPKDIPRDQLKSLMKEQSRALGVECDHCHDMPEADRDTRHKETAREMMRMTNDINEKYLKSAKVKVSCATCHRGKEKPEAGRR